MVADGHLQTGFDPLSVGLGVMAFPAALLGWQWFRARNTPARLVATGPVATAVNILLFVALVLTPLYATPLAFTSGAALIFYGGSMLLAALRGYAGCEVLAISNWVLRRDDEIGCLVLSPIDRLEATLRR
ncbi:MAG TPA: hypothetical protein VNV65_04620 [Candidatus Solibacter sp.]|jgi:hypothetical protein|nr:hypothetical protein [Candidatus Solibacter sp.]